MRSIDVDFREACFGSRGILSRDEGVVKGTKVEINVVCRSTSYMVCEGSS